MGEQRILGYARVSSTGQNLDRQIVELKKYVPEDNIVVDKASGKNLDRPGYQALKGALGLRKGDVLVIKSLDRLSRNKREIKQELEWFREKGIILKIIDLPTTMIQLPEGQEWIVIEVLSSIAEEERRTIHQRQKEGIAAAREKGVIFGRPQKDYPEQWEYYYEQYRKGILTRKFILQQMGIGVDRFKYLVKKYDKSQK